MIRIAKSDNKPLSLTTTNAYDGEDVKRQLLLDQQCKCYLCERKVSTDFQIDHLKSKQNHPELRTEWTNLLLSCSYCNPKKGNRFNSILNPIDNDIEDIIEQRINYSLKAVVFKSNEESQEVQETISLLETIFNGGGVLKRVREEKFYEEVEAVMNRFNQLIDAYRYNPSKFTEEAVREELSIDKELLGFKYWIIKTDEVLSQVFANDIIWNKTA